MKQAHKASSFSLLPSLLIPLLARLLFMLTKVQRLPGARSSEASITPGGMPGRTPRLRADEPTAAATDSSWERQS